MPASAETAFARSSLALVELSIDDLPAALEQVEMVLPVLDSLSFDPLMNPFIAYLACSKLKLRHDIAAPAGMIGASNFFELAVAVAITLFGAFSPVVLVTVVGVLVEVPVMLVLVRFANQTARWFPQEV